MVAAAEQRSLLAVSRIGVPAVLLAMPVTLQQHSVQLIVLVLSVCDLNAFVQEALVNHMRVCTWCCTADHRMFKRS